MLCALLVDAAGSDLHGFEPICSGHTLVASVASGGHRPYDGYRLALAYLLARTRRDGIQASGRDPRPAPAHHRGGAATGASAVGTGLAGGGERGRRA